MKLSLEREREVLLPLQSNIQRICWISCLQVDKFMQACLGKVEKAVAIQEERDKKKQLALEVKKAAKAALKVGC